MKRISIIGFGPFAKVMIKEIQDDFDVVVYSRNPKEKDRGNLSFQFVTLAEALAAEIIVIGIPAQFIANFLKINAHLINPKALVLDVASVKVQPAQDMQALLPSTCDIIGTHPLFGPGSAAKGVVGLQIVLCPLRCTQQTLEKLITFLENKELIVLKKSPEEHDRAMAYVLGLTHYIGRAIQLISIPKMDFTTPAYAALLNMRDIQGGHSWDLFYSIARLNPYAEEVISQFREAFAMLDKQLDKAEPFHQTNP